jgi:putative transposase
VHFVRDMLGHVPKPNQPVVRGALKQIFAAPDHPTATDTSRASLRNLAPVAPKVARLLADAEQELLAYMRFPRDHWTKTRSTNPLERVNLEIARRSDVVGIYPNDAALVRLATLWDCQSDTRSGVCAGCRMGTHSIRVNRVARPRGRRPS